MQAMAGFGGSSGAADSVRLLVAAVVSGDHRSTHKHHVAAVALYAHHNVCRPDETLGTTSGIALGIAGCLVNR